MPAVIPVIAAFASGAVGAVVAGTAGFAAYATVAGAVLGGIGAITGNKSLGKIGAILSLGAGIAGFASAASGAGGAAAAGIDSAATAGDYVNAMDAASDAASAAGGAGAGATTAVSAVGSSASNLADNASSLTSGLSDVTSTLAAPVTTAGANAGAAGNGLFGATAGVDPNALATGLPGIGDAAGSGTSLMDAASNSLAPAGTSAGIQPVAGSAEAAIFGQEGYGATASPAELTRGSALTDAGKGLTMKDIQSFYEKAAKAVGGLGEWAQKNQLLASTGLQALGAAYGPQAEQLDMQKSLMERARANLNAPVRINFNKGG